MAAPDFYFALNATFRWLADTFGEAELRRYWETLGREHYAAVTARFAAGGLPAVRDYWQACFEAEPGGDVQVSLQADRVLIEVRVCPAIAHLRAHDREVMPLYCEHCRVVSQAMGAGAGLTVEVSGGDGACRQVFRKRDGA